MLVEDVGVDRFVDYSAPEEHLISEIRELTGGGPHAAIVVAAVEAPIVQAIEASFRDPTAILLLFLIFHLVCANKRNRRRCWST